MDYVFLTIVAVAVIAVAVSIGRKVTAQSGDHPRGGVRATRTAGSHGGAGWYAGGLDGGGGFGGGGDCGVGGGGDC